MGTRLEYKRWYHRLNWAAAGEEAFLLGQKYKISFLWFKIHQRILLYNFLPICLSSNYYFCLVEECLKSPLMLHIWKVAAEIWTLAPGSWGKQNQKMKAIIKRTEEQRPQRRAVFIAESPSISKILPAIFAFCLPSNCVLLETSLSSRFEEKTGDLAVTLVSLS